MGEPGRIECRRLGRRRASLGDRRIGGGKKGTPRRRREHPRRPRHRGSYDLGAALLDATLPGGLKEQDATRPRPAMADDQHDVIDFLSTPSSYGAAVERVDVTKRTPRLCSWPATAPTNSSAQQNIPTSISPLQNGAAWPARPSSP